MANLGDTILLKSFSKFYQGAAPVAHISSLTELGNGGNYSAAANIDILDPTHITQGPALANLTNGTQAGVVSELINHILDKAVAADVTYGVGATKLFKISSTAVASGGSPSWPQAITNMTDGESVIELSGNVYIFYNKASGGDIAKMPVSNETIDPDWGSSVPTGAAALQKAAHPSAKKGDLILFGNGRYLGTYNGTSNTLAPTKLDFGSDAEVVDIVFHANQWLIAVNYGVSGTNKNYSEVYFYEASATSSLLADEAAVGFFKIGFLNVENGVVKIAYQDLTFTGGYNIGYLFGRQVKALGHFTGSLPNFAQKTIYKNTTVFPSSGLLYSDGAVVEELPHQISQLADGGYATIGAVAAPFGTPMVASTDGGSNHRLAQFSGFDTACTWRSIVVPLVNGEFIAHLDYIVFRTKVLGASARSDWQIEYNQAVSTAPSTAIQISGTGSTRFVKSLGISNVEDFRVYGTWASGSASNDCAIKEIQVYGHWVDKPGS